MELIVVAALVVYLAVADATEKNGFDPSGKLVPTPGIRKGSPARDNAARADRGCPALPGDL